VAVRGKAKADYYAQEKVVEGRMRFYNAFPRQMMLNMQTATQVLELNAKHIGQNSSHSGIGMSLVRGGAAELVAALQRQLDEDLTRAYVHVGDDSWVILKQGAEMCMFALDCSNFDLTQHGAVTEAVHQEVRTELARVDKVAADLWYAYARERLVVTTGSIVRRWKHAGPSGMPLQSKVNDMLMDVMSARVVEALQGSLDEEVIVKVLNDTGEGMGFAVRLEQYWRGRTVSMVESLTQCPFLFVGYHFHVRDGSVRVHCDVPRMMAQLPFPALKWVATKGELQVTEAMRLGSISLNLGMPTAELEASFAEFRSAAVELLEDTIRRFGDRDDPKLRWAVMENPLAESTKPSLEGLLTAVKRDPAELWMVHETELLSDSVLVDLDWAEAMEEEERQGDVLAGFVRRRPPMTPAVRRVPIAPGRTPTHPASLRNDGRPPPTAVWGPDKAPRLRDGIGPVARRRLQGQQGNAAFDEMSDDTLESELSEEDYFD